MLGERVATVNNQMISNIYTVVNDIFKLGIKLILHTLCVLVDQLIRDMFNLTIITNLGGLV